MSKSNRVIYKYEICSAESGNPQVVGAMMPDQYTFLSAQLQMGVIVLWALVDPTHQNTYKEFRLVLTGEAFPEEDDFAHLATLQVSVELVLHLFKRIKL